MSVGGTVSETATLYLDETKEFAFKVGKFVVVAGFLMEVTQLIALVSLGVVIIMFALALMRRKLGLTKFLEEKRKKKVYNTDRANHN